VKANNKSSDISAALESWYARHRGGELCLSIGNSLRPVLDLAFGYHILQLGPLVGIDLIQHSPINHRIFASRYMPVAQGGEPMRPRSMLRCHGDEIPLESDSVDMLVAFHALEFDENPHGTLREMLRVLRPQGHLAIVGFNPRSLLGISQYVRRINASDLWEHHRPVSPQRLSDWLRLVHCEVESIQHLHPLPFAGRGRLRRMLQRFDDWATRRDLPVGSIYMVHAIKQIGALRRPRPLGVRTRERLTGLAVARQPSATPRRNDAEAGRNHAA
jgi:SAM-dependent methyltransferase